MPRTCNITRRCSGKVCNTRSESCNLARIRRHAMVVWEMDRPHRENASVSPALRWVRQRKSTSVVPRSDQAMLAPRTAYKYIVKGPSLGEQVLPIPCIVGAHDRYTLRDNNAHCKPSLAKGVNGRVWARAHPW
jgi:hypothetical protein